MDDNSRLQALALLIGNDGHAISFQSLGQYRTALLTEVKRLRAVPETYTVLLPVLESKAAQEIQAARLSRQLEHKHCGFPTGRDAAYTSGELAREAAAYLVAAMGCSKGYALRYFPWDSLHWKTETPRGYLIKAAALCRDEIERLDRSAQVTRHD